MTYQTLCIVLYLFGMYSTASAHQYSSLYHQQPLNRAFQIALLVWPVLIFLLLLRHLYDLLRFVFGAK